MKKVFFLGIAAATMLASCSKNETVDVPQGKAIGFSNTFVDNATRSVVDPSFTTTSLGNFAVYGFTQNGQIFDGDVVQSQDNGATWDYSPKKYWIEGNQYAFGAIAPANNANITVSKEAMSGTSVADYKVRMEVTFTNADGTIDLLHAAPAAINADATFIANPSKVKMTFSHQLSKVKFSFINSIGENYKIEVTNVKITNAKGSGTLTIGDKTTANTWGNSATGNVSLDFGNVVAAEATGTDVANTAQPIDFTKEGETYNERLMIPYPASGVYTVQFHVQLYDGTVPMWQTPKSFEVQIQNVEFKLGYCYDFKATLTNDNITGPDEPGLKPIEFEVGSIEPWVDDEVDQTVPGFGTDETGDEGDSN